ncbi:hypothetical protein L218DRAFT_1005414 [Marasmius fiardii PR-910]|nr:hypothetical protein L218DRAFT_1005414 [Marasmius fiardii PR-910]
MSSKSGEPPRGCGSGRSSSASAVAARSSGSAPPPTSRVFSPPEDSQRQPSIPGGLSSVLSPEARIREESDSTSTTRRHSRVSSPASVSDTQSDAGDQEMEGVSEGIAVLLELSRFGGSEGLQADIRAILQSFDTLEKWIFLQSSQEGSSPFSIGLDDIRENAGAIINHIDSLNPGGDNTICVTFDDQHQV